MRLPVPKGAVRGAQRAGARLINRPTGVGGRHRPFYHLNLVQRVRGPRTLGERVRDKVVLITGASSGIGETAALKIGEAGGTVLLVARTREKLEDLKGRVEERGGSAHVHPADLSDTEDIERMATEVLEQHGRVDVLVNNAGRSIRRSVELSYDRFHDFERTMQLNYFGAVRLILALLPSMRERRSGHVINISSAGVQTKVPRFSGYVASKAALDAFSDCVAAEVAHDGVHFTTIHMPLVRTPMIAPTTIYRSFPAIPPDQAAEMICQAVLYRPRRIGTMVGNAAAVLDAVSPTSLDAIRNTGYRLFPDSSAARGGKEKGEAEKISPVGAVFARVMRGPHW